MIKELFNPMFLSSIFILLALVTTIFGYSVLGAKLTIVSTMLLIIHCAKEMK